MDVVWLTTLQMHMYSYRNDPKFSDTQKICCNHSKIWTMWLYHRVMSPNDADGMSNSVDPDQTAPLGAVWSGSTLFAQAYLSENLGSLWYSITQTYDYLSEAHFSSTLCVWTALALASLHWHPDCVRANSKGTGQFALTPRLCACEQ